ncbi:MAG: M48 family metallopeptidase [Bdellovibrionia bacterium]
MKWPALFHRHAGTVEIANFAIVFTPDEGWASAEIPINQVTIKVRGSNTQVYHFIDRFNEEIKITVEDPGPLEILARRGITEAKQALERGKKRTSFRILRYVLPIVFVLGFIVAVPYLLAVVPAEWLDMIFPPEREKVVGRLLFENINAKFGVDTGHKVNPKLQALVDRLTQSNPSLSAHKPQIFFSNSPDVNAFALAGGYIICNRGLIEGAESLEEITGVIAHELGHVQLRHVTRSLLTALGATGTYLVISAVIGGDTAVVVNKLTGLLQLKYSRNQEQRADDRGFTLLVKAKVAPAGLVRFFKKLEVLPGAPKTEHLAFLSTHPLTTERIESIEAKLKPYPASEWAPVEGSLEDLKASIK